MISSKTWARSAIVSAGVLTLLAAALPGIGADSAPAGAPRPKANYELAAEWTSQKIGKLVFDLAATPHWLESGDRFWYSFENTRGRKFWLVDPVRKTRTYVFDPVKLAAALTSATGLPYDSQHLPITVIRFVRNDSAIQFEINVPRDAVIPGETKTTITTTQQTDAGQQNDNLDPPQQQQGRGGSLYGAAAGPQSEAAHLRIRALERQATDAERAPAPQARVGFHLAGWQDGRIRAQTQSLHDGRRQLCQGAEGRQGQVDRRNAAHHRWRGGFRLRRRPRRRPATAAGAAGE